MTDGAVKHLIACQAALIEALDAQDVHAIEAATTELAEAVDALRRVAAAGGDEEAAQIDYALRQSQAARIRVNCLSQWNSQKIDRLQQIRGIQPARFASKY